MSSCNRTPNQSTPVWNGFGGGEEGLDVDNRGVGVIGKAIDQTSQEGEAEVVGGEEKKLAENHLKNKSSDSKNKGESHGIKGEVGVEEGEMEVKSGEAIEGKTNHTL